MIEKGLSSKLWLLSKNIAETVNEFHNNGKIVKIKRLYIKPKFEKFEYKEGGVNYTKSFDYIEKEEWNWRDRFDFVEKVIKQLPGYSEIVFEISKKYSVNDAQAEFWLSSFVGVLIQKVQEGLIDEILVDNITTFIADLERAPIEWRPKIWIEGIWLKDEEYEIYDGLKIRRPKPSDVEIETPFDMMPFQTISSGYREFSSAILELSYRSRSNESRIEIDVILNCLRLYRVGSIFYVKIEMRPKSFITSGGTTISGRRFSSTYKYSINKKDIPKLRDFIGKIKNLLPKEFLTVSSEKIDPVIIALQRYNDALLKSESIESRITSAITCFEALYLKAKERMELSHRLSQRASVLLRVFGFKPLEVYNILSKAYEIRSTFVHGSQITLEERKNAVKIAEKILEYSRVSLLIFFQIKHLVSKEVFIRRIDNSILEERADSKLKVLLKENCTIY